MKRFTNVLLLTIFLHNTAHAASAPAATPPTAQPLRATLRHTGLESHYMIWRLYRLTEQAQAVTAPDQARR